MCINIYIYIFHCRVSFIIIKSSVQKPDKTFLYTTQRASDEIKL